MDGKEAILNQIAAPEAPKAEVLPIDELESVKNGWITPQIMHEIKGLCETSSGKDLFFLVYIKKLFI